MSEHHETLAPSSWPALVQCGQFTSSPAEGAHVERGTIMHEALAATLTDGTVPQLSEDDADEVQWAADYVRAEPTAKLHCEERVELVSDEFEPITFGTADVWFETLDDDGEKTVHLFDLKTGEVSESSAQLAAYSAALLQQTGATRVVATLLFSRYRTTRREVFDRESTNEIVARVLDNVAKQTLRANKFCGWCSKGLTCYAFAKQARAIRENLGWELEDFEPEKIADDPEQLGNALRLAKHVKAWATTVEDHAKTLEDAPPGWRWSIRKTQSVANYGEALKQLGIKPPAADMDRSATVAEIAKLWAKEHGVPVKEARVTVANELKIETKETKTLKEKN